MNTKSKSYSGATIQVIKEDFKKAHSRDEIHAVIIHAGTNNLCSEDDMTTAKHMEDLILEVKKKSSNVAISSVVNRFDNKVAHSKISKFNILLNNLCQKHKLSFIDNNNIDHSMLNGSNLHLNKEGDRMLGRSFCQYLRSLRQSKPLSGVNFWSSQHRTNFHPKNFMNFLEHLFHSMRY